MDSDDDLSLSHSQSKQYSLLRSDLSAALSSFDRAQDWADLIHDLQRVNRVLNKHSTSTFLPEKALLAKRLSQCLTSFLPSGVHLKALETYHLVFKRIGPARLARDLPLYAAGLFPLFSHCATALKAPLLSLYETHLLPLGLALRPVLDGFVLAVLPGLDDESSGFYNRSLKLLDNIGTAVQDFSIFATSLWKALLLSPPIRLSASHYLRLTLATDDHAYRANMVADMPLVAYAITAALSDEDALTKRSVLDLLLGELALDSPFFETHSEKHREGAVALVGGVFGALLKRDMSLTKRVHAWFLGGKDSQDGINFCTKYTTQLVLAAMDNEIHKCSQSLHGTNAVLITRPCRIAAAILDREELSQCLGHHFALNVLQYSRAAVTNLDEEREKELRHSVSDLLHDLGSGRVFAELERMLASEKEKTHEDFELLSFALSMFPTTNEVVRRKHLPALLRVAVQSLNSVSTDALMLDKAVAFCTNALKSMRLSRNWDVEESVAKDLTTAVSSFASFFVAWLAHVVEPAPPELRRAYTDVSISEEYSAEVRMAAVCESRKEFISLAKGACMFFVTAAKYNVGGIDALTSSLQAMAKCASAADVRISLAGARAFSEISASLINYVPRTHSGADDQVLGVIRRCWRQMHPSLSTATPQSAQTLLGLQSRFPEETNIVVADGILSTDLSRRLRNLERFACLWRLAVEHRLMPFPADNGLFLMLDALTDEDWAPKMLARSWLSDALEVDAASVLDAPLRLLLTPSARTVGHGHEFVAAYDAPRALYGFQVLRGILESCTTVDSSAKQQGFILQSPTQIARRDGKRGRTGVLAMAAAALSARTGQALSTVFGPQANSSGENAETNTPADDSNSEGPVQLVHLLPVPSYVVAVALTCLGYLRGRVPKRFSSPANEPQVEEAQNGDAVDSVRSLDTSDDDFLWLSAGLGFKPLDELHAGVSAAAAECLATLFRAISVPSQLSAYISQVFSEPVLNLLKFNADKPDPVLQLHYLNAVSFLVTADGPCFMSAVRGKEAFMKRQANRARLSYSDSHNQLSTLKSMDMSPRGIQVGAVESLNHFVPWLLNGVCVTCKGAQSGLETGSHEILGVRRRWIQFIETTMHHVGPTLPIVTEGLLCTLLELLNIQSQRAVSAQHAADSEFSRVDETLVILEGLTVVVSNILWSFEYALSNGDLKDDSAAGAAQGLNRSTAGLVVEDVSSVATQDNRLETPTNANERGAISIAPPNGQTGLGANVTSATAMISAMNPLRMINDFVKDVLGGAGSEGANRLLDPRRSGARLLFSLLPSVLDSVVRIWGPLADSSVAEIRRGVSYRSTDDAAPPRLSTELPKERRQTQRLAVLSVLEPVFALRPTDFIAAVIGLFSAEQDDFGAMREDDDSDSIARTACQILHSMEDVTQDVVLACVRRIFEKSVKWDRTSADSKEGTKQLSFRREARQVTEKVVTSGFRGLGDEDFKKIGRMSPIEVGSNLPGGAVGLDIGISGSHGNGNSTHDDVFHWGDFFAKNPAGRVETACFTFLDTFLSTRKAVEDIQSLYSVVYSLLKDAFGGAKRKSTVLAIQRVFGTFIAGSPTPFPDRKARREIMVLAVTAISTTSSIASASADVSIEEVEGRSKDMYKRELAIHAMRVLASTVPVLVDSAFLDDKPQLSNTVSACLVPAVSALKKAASRAASAQTLADNVRRMRGTFREPSPKRIVERKLDNLSSIAAVEVILPVSNRDWGVKLARRELLTLLEDSNFFFGKTGGVLEKTSKIVREVIASGGASTLLTSLGSTTSNGTPGIPSLFTGRDSETILRARAIRRMAYCVFVSEPDFYSPQLPSVLERIRDALRMSEPRLVAECLLCLRALLLRIGPSSISAFRATTLSELFRIASKPSDDVHATVAALKFLDLTTVLSPADYGYERCFFFGEDRQDILEGDELVPFKPLSLRLSQLWTETDRNQKKVFEAPLRLEKGRTVFGGAIPRTVDEEFVGRYAQALMERNSMPEMLGTPVDMDTICQELELEFVE